MKFPDNCDVKKRTAADYLQWQTVSSPPPSLCLMELGYGQARNNAPELLIYSCLQAPFGQISGSPNLRSTLKKYFICLCILQKNRKVFVCLVQLNSEEHLQFIYKYLQASLAGCLVFVVSDILFLLECDVW